LVLESNIFRGKPSFPFFYLCCPEVSGISVSIILKKIQSPEITTPFIGKAKLKAAYSFSLVKCQKHIQQHNLPASTTG